MGFGLDVRNAVALGLGGTASLSSVNGESPQSEGILLTEAGFFLLQEDSSLILME